MNPLTRCGKCETAIFPSHVYKTVTIDNSPQHVAIIYACPKCGLKGKLVAEETEWESRRDRYHAAQAKAKTDFRAHEIELDAVESVDDLVALWASLKNPPLIEEVMCRCGCATCRKNTHG